MEVWKDIEGFEGIYQISNLGRVKVLDREVPHWRGGVSIRKSRIINPYKTNAGYMIVSLTKECKESRFLVHRLVAKSFLSNRNKKAQVNHINGIKTDNSVGNLEWCSRSENIRHADKNNLRVLKGEKNSGSKLTEKQVLEIRAIGKSKTLTEIAEMYNVGYKCISKILNRKRWKHI